MTVVEETRGLPSRTEFVALMAMLTAMVAFSIDSMMPVLPRIAAELSAGNPNAAQLVITSFVLGMGIGTFFTGPLSDQFGRRAVIIGGAMIYVAAALAAMVSQNMTWLLVTRLVQGLGAAGPRVGVMAVTRDLYAGRGMAQIVSFTMMVFSIVPALAPLMGAQIVKVFEWHAIFGSFALFGVAVSLWYIARLPETLPVARRRPFRPATIRAALIEMAALRQVRLSIVALALCFAPIFATISSIQPIYAEVLGRADSFPMWFGLTAVIAASSSFVNAKLVMRFGMRFMVRAMLIVYIALSLILLAVLASGPGPLGLFSCVLAWQQVQFYQAGLTIGNLNAIAMEPLGHIAGTAASVISALATVVAVMLAAPVGLAFDGTPFPLMLGCLGFAVVALASIVWLGSEPR